MRMKKINLFTIGLRAALISGLISCGKEKSNDRATPILSAENANHTELTCEFERKKGLAFEAGEYSWTNTNVSVSFAPDGTLTPTGPLSNLFAKFDAKFPRATWQREIAKALQLWANSTPLNFHLVADSGADFNGPGSSQGNSGFGDMRIGGFEGGEWAGSAFGPGGTGTLGGDWFLNTLYNWSIGSGLDISSLSTHESGHAIGLEHSSLTNAIMYPSILQTYTALSADDIAGAQAMYGARQHDIYDAAAANNTQGTATALSLSTSGAANFGADLTTMTDIDYYRVIAPSGTTGALTASVDPRNLSLLAPKVMVYNASGTLLGQTAMGSFDYGKVATVNVTGLVAGQTYYVVADGGTTDVFGMGAYVLDVRFGMGSVSAPAAPSSLSATTASTSQINLAWADNASNEDGAKIERSSDGVNFTQIATAVANSTSYEVTGLSASSTYHFRLRAYNGGGNSGYSNIAQATTQTPAPSTPSAPSSLNATAASTSQINLVWVDNASNEDGVNIERSSDGVNFTQIATAAANATSYAATGLSASSTYHFRIRAYNGGGNSGYSNIAQATTQTAAPSIPSAPSSLSATAASTSQINLAWVDNSDNEEGFRIERSSDGTNFSQIATAAANAASFSATGLSAATNYSFRIRAYNVSGDSSYSNTASAITSSLPSDLTPPVVNILSPSANAIVSGIVEVRVAATDDSGVVSISLSVDGQLVSSTSTANATFSWNSVPFTNGSHTLLVAATDSAGNTGTTSIAVEVNNSIADITPPTIAITSPVANAKVKGIVKIMVNTQDNVGVARVDCFVDGVLSGSSNLSPFTTTWNTKKARVGAHTLSCKSFDGAGNIGVSAPITVTK